MESLNQFVNSLAPKLSHWRRDFHHYAESGWVEFRTATLVAEELHQLGYSLALCNFAFFSGLIGAQFWAERAQPKSPELDAKLLVSC